MCRSPLYARHFRAVLSIYPKLPRIYVGLRCIANGKVNREKDYRTQKEIKIIQVWKIEIKNKIQLIQKLYLRNNVQNNPLSWITSLTYWFTL